jgi:formylglycine-generating enzyme required for sulfatase activity
MTISRTILALAAAIMAASFALPADAQRGLQITAKQLETMRTETRVALVIGNASYKTQPLRNPVNDARAMSKKLRSLGFDVIERINVNKKRMQASIIDFGKKLADGGVGVFYFAGHGIQNRSRNFILPVDAQMQDEDYLRVEGVNVDEVLSEMGDAGNRLNVLILDACRNNPYRSRTRGARSGGLAQMHAPTGTYISYAAAPGEVAFDGDGKHSPYTGALLEVIGQPGVKLEAAFKRVRTKVHGVTGGRQVPFTEETVMGEFYFTVPDENSVAGGRASGGQTNEDKLWTAVKDSKRAKDYSVFLKQFPNSVRAPLAKSRLDDLQRQQTAGLAPAPQGKQPSQTRPAVGVFPQGYKPGDTFKDCADCPEMVVIPAGSFMMGSPASAPHRVTISKPFAVGKFEVTQAEWRSVMGTNPSKFVGHRNPVERVSWDDVQAYVKKLTAKTGKRYRLLSEAEWEYAARARTTTTFHTGDRITTGQANFNGNYTYNGSSKGQYRKRTVAVGSFPANVFGLHDIHGNVWEWVEDCMNKNYLGAPTDGSVWNVGDCSRRVLRGGSWYTAPAAVRAAARSRNTTGGRDKGSGFRIARTLF